MLEDDGKAANARDFYSLAGAIRMRQEKFADAAETMLRFGASCDAANAHASLRKAYLSAVVAQLYAGNGAEAQQCTRTSARSTRFKIPTNSVARTR